MNFFILNLLLSGLYVVVVRGQYVLQSRRQQQQGRQRQQNDYGWREVPSIQQQQQQQQVVTPNYFMRPQTNNIYNWPLYPQVQQQPVPLAPAPPLKIPVYQNNIQNPFNPQNHLHKSTPSPYPQFINNNDNQLPWNYFSPAAASTTTTSKATTTTTRASSPLDLNQLFNQQKAQQHLSSKFNVSSASSGSGGGPRIIIDDNCMKCLCFIESWCSDVGCVMDQGSLSCGWYQLKYEYWLDCGSPGGDWKTCANSKPCAADCVRKYMERYGPGCMPNVAQPECPDLLRIHNGGPQGCKAPHTEYYGWLISRCLKRESPYENIDSQTTN